MTLDTHCMPLDRKRTKYICMCKQVMYSDHADMEKMHCASLARLIQIASKHLPLAEEIQTGQSQ